jgi:predicted nucleic acid-binding protein
MFYLDTSLLVAALTDEVHTVSTQTWLAMQRDDAPAISDWVTSEFSAALSIKLRTGQINPQRRAAMLAAFTTLTVEALTVWPVSRNQFRTAARFADQYALGLRAGDALHLAIAADHGATLCTLDRRLADAGPALGVKTLLL